MFLSDVTGIVSLIHHWYFLRQHGLKQANQISTHLSDQEKRELFKLVRLVRPDHVVEIGCYLGSSTSFLATAMLKYAPGSTLHCVDTWQNDAMAEGKRDTFAEFKQNTKGFESILRPVRNTSSVAAQGFTQQIDLLFVDGDHSEEAVTSDWLQWYPHLKRDAMVVMHDFGWAPGVKRVVERQISPRAVTERRLPNMYWARLGRM